MLGGKLLTTNSIIIQHLDLVIAAYSHQLYLFSYNQTTIQHRVAHHQYPIIALHRHSDQYIYTLDQQGFQCILELKPNSGLQVIEINKKKIKNGEIKESRYIYNEDNDLQVICLHKNGNVIKYTDSYEHLMIIQAHKILLINDQYLIISRKQSKNIEVISIIDNKVIYSYQHTSNATSAQIYQNNLIVADHKGKIHILANYMEKGKVELRQKLEWHTQQISCLQIEGAYLYSAGQEGVVVMWHLRQNKKDFLPRIGSEISNLTVNQSIICCFLTDNTMKVIDLNNDKQILHYKLIINPNNNQISYLSQQKTSSKLLKTSSKNDKIFMRSVAGKIQQLNLINGINIQHNILNRNIISRLDNYLPIPHQITNICFSNDEKYLAIAIEGVNYRVIKFYQYNGEELKLISKVENCHKGNSPIKLINLHNNKFLSFSSSDKNIKTWRIQTRSKESIMQVQQEYWCCQYQINCRQLLPKDITLNRNKLFILYPYQFIIFNLDSKLIQNVYNILNNNSQPLALYQIIQNNIHRYLIFYQQSIEILSSFNNIINQIEIIVKFQTNIKRQNILFNQKYNKFAVLEQTEDVDHVYLKTLEKDNKSQVNHYQISKGQNLIGVTDIFWIQDRLIAVDDNLLFYNITHDKQLLRLSKNNALKHLQSQCIQGEELQNEDTTYQYLYNKYLQRQSRKDEAIMNKFSETLSMTPSINASFQLLANQLFI